MRRFKIVDEDIYPGKDRLIAEGVQTNRGKIIFEWPGKNGHLDIWDSIEEFPYYLMKGAMKFKWVDEEIINE